MNGYVACIVHMKSFANPTVLRSFHVPKVYHVDSHGGSDAVGAAKSIFTPFGKANVRAGTHGPAQPTAGRHLGKDRWGFTSVVAEKA